MVPASARVRANGFAMRIGATLRAVRFILDHPLGRISRRRTLTQYLRWQIGSRLAAGPIGVPFIDETRLFVRPGMQGATGNVYVGLHELEPMGFALHALRPDDLLLDVGANIGSYTLIGAGACGARVHAFEPVPATSDDLATNIRLNDLSDQVCLHRAAVGRRAGTVSISTDRDTTNHVVPDGQESLGETRPTTEVPVVALDDLPDLRSDSFAGILVKIDVEGFEVDVLKGAREILKDGRLIGVIIEINGSGNVYGNSDNQILELLTATGLREVSYDPIGRELEERATAEPTRIFVRDPAEVRSRIAAAPQHRLGIGVNI